MKRTGALWWLVLGLLALVACSRSPALDRPFSLREGESATLLETNLTIEVEHIIHGLDGSNEMDAGSVYLRVTAAGGESVELYLETGQEAQVDSYLVRLESVVHQGEDLTCRLLVVKKAD